MVLGAGQDGHVRLAGWQDLVAPSLAWMLCWLLGWAVLCRAVWWCWVCADEDEMLAEAATTLFPDETPA